MISDSQITALNKYLSVTNGREKLCRLVQYFARFYAFYLLQKGASQKTIQQWTDLKTHLATGRKLFRLLKPLELAQSSIKSLSLEDPVLRMLHFIKFASNFFYFNLEALSLVDTVNFLKLRNIKRINRLGLKCWLISLIASILSGLYQLRKLSVRVDDRKTLDDKGDSKLEQKKMKKQIDAVRYQLCQDFFDICIPVGSLKWLKLNEAAIGIAGVVSSAMAMNTQWKKANSS
ncbi:peroxisomal biogenesis factor 11 [Mycotypha africana]|uniref:peroxisomal biogenesis factor 11 n=1 Tax=Mycotypha africana TaxID=64632 RepID=UPI002300F9FE|nr:peroxisomal biogenesis factor 11 [Mycotypha africana]KAI8987596.1 peroxisomal biogenesis factor 11 [Mycotypha africana]